MKDRIQSGPTPIPPCEVCGEHPIFMWCTAAMPVSGGHCIHGEYQDHGFALCQKCRADIELPDDSVQKYLGKKKLAPANIERIDDGRT
ncbi:hypothetical protein LCGC14_1131460 [marine sediment metagenome]|uniref:Uncharacterized protein n=1 Tax=marine sediment metagenome TaxID=412755 RepID=A0A0F9MNS4_9ZZZZ